MSGLTDALAVSTFGTVPCTIGTRQCNIYATKYLSETNITKLGGIGTQNHVFASS